jgi:hypothetical protein
MKEEYGRKLRRQRSFGKRDRWRGLFINDVN